MRPTSSTGGPHPVTIHVAPGESQPPARTSQQIREAAAGRLAALLGSAQDDTLMNWCAEAVRRIDSTGRVDLGGWADLLTGPVLAGDGLVGQQPANDLLREVLDVLDACVRDLYGLDGMSALHLAISPENADPAMRLFSRWAQNHPALNTVSIDATPLPGQPAPPHGVLLDACDLPDTVGTLVVVPCEKLSIFAKPHLECRASRLQTADERDTCSIVYPGDGFEGPQTGTGLHEPQAAASSRAEVAKPSLGTMANDTAHLVATFLPQADISKLPELCKAFSQRAWPLAQMQPALDPARLESFLQRVESGQARSPGHAKLNLSPLITQDQLERCFRAIPDLYGLSWMTGSGSIPVPAHGLPSSVRELALPLADALTELAPWKSSDLKRLESAIFPFGAAELFPQLEDLRCEYVAPGNLQGLGQLRSLSIASAWNLEGLPRNLQHFSIGDSASPVVSGFVRPSHLRVLGTLTDLRSLRIRRLENDWLAHIVSLPTTLEVLMFPGTSADTKALKDWFEPLLDSLPRLTFVDFSRSEREMSQTQGDLDSWLISLGATASLNGRATFSRSADRADGTPGSDVETKRPN